MVLGLSSAECKWCRDVEAMESCWGGNKQIPPSWKQGHCKRRKEGVCLHPPWKALFTETLICWWFQQSQIMLSSWQANFLIFLSRQIERIFLGWSERSWGNNHGARCGNCKWFREAVGTWNPPNWIIWDEGCKFFPGISYVPRNEKTSGGKN